MTTSATPPFALRSTCVVTPDGIRDAAVIVQDGYITAVIDSAAIPIGLKVNDVGDLVVSPGLVDPHVHINEPGRTEWEGFATASRAAAAGGVTTLVDMPLNSSPVTTTLDAFALKRAAAGRELYVDCGFHAGLVPANTSSLTPLLRSGVLGVKAFLIHSGIDEFPNVGEKELRRAMPAIAESGLPLLVHAEISSAPSVSRLKHANPEQYRQYLAARPRSWENDAIALMIRLCKEFGCRVHIVHLSSSEAVPMLREAKAAGLPITVETCPHYLYFSAEDIPDGATHFKCAPPIRESYNKELLWDALRDGVIDFLASDHSPCLPAMKLPESGDFMNAWGGISSLQLGLSIIWTEARKRGFSLPDVGRWLATNPAKLVGLAGRKGAIVPGAAADLVVWHPEELFVVEAAQIYHRHTLTPYEGRTLQGKVYATYLRGIKVFDRGSFSKPSGTILLRDSR